MKKLMKYAGTAILILSMIYTMYAVGLLRYDLNELSETYFSALNDINNRYNQLINNELELLKQFKEESNKSAENLKLSEKYTVLELDLIRKNINKISQKIYLTDEILYNILNSDVFVDGIFGQGAGTVIKKTNENMYILTCAHVVEDIYKINQEGIHITGKLGYSKTDNKNLIKGLILYSYEIIKYDEKNDLALLKTSVIDDNLIAIDISETEPEKGDTIYSVGSPLGNLRTISKGILSNKIEKFYISDNTITYGNSGGGLYDNKGELIGVPSNVMGYNGGINKEGEEQIIPESGLGLSINLQIIKDFLKGIDY
jgi:S1-C subfamily serine protease